MRRMLMSARSASTSLALVAGCAGEASDDTTMDDGNAGTNGSTGSECAEADRAVETSGCPVVIGCAVSAENDGETECSTAYACPGRPAYELHCKEDECLCLIDGVPNGDSCPSEMICRLDFESIDERAAQCCGFDAGRGRAYR